MHGCGVMLFTRHRLKNCENCLSRFMNPGFVVYVRNTQTVYLHMYTCFLTEVPNLEKIWEKIRIQNKKYPLLFLSHAWALTDTYSRHKRAPSSITCNTFFCTVDPIHCITPQYYHTAVYNCFITFLTVRQIISSSPL